MAIRVAINHKTAYAYDRPVSLSPHIFRLRPAVHSRTSIEAYSFQVSPKNHFLNWQQDPFGNFQARVVFPEKTTELRVDVEVIVSLRVINPFDFFVEDYAEHYPFSYQRSLHKELAPYLEICEDGPRLREWIRTADCSRQHINDFLVRLNRKLNHDIAYSIRMEAGVQSCEETLIKAIGSCRDSAWLLVQILRHLGLAARFVSGYLVQLTADVKSLDGPSGPDQDFTDLHAWVEVYIPGAGWVGLDPTSGLFAGEGHIPLACTPDYASAAPVVGSTEECETVFSFSNSVRRIHEDPRVTKPYTQEQWAAIEATGLAVDKDLELTDARMTMGGEPTFVSIDDMESPEWNTKADGQHKRKLARELIFRLRSHFGPSGMIYYGQGKWYPGEPLPRWQYGLYFRKDGYPVWQNGDLIAQERPSAKRGPTDAEKFTSELARHLAVSPLNASAAYEDIFYFLWAEGKLPVNVDPLKANLNDSLERKTLAQLLDQGLGEPAGYVLPLQWDYWNNTWQSCKWVMKRDQIFLIPGNSAMGLRLPLDSLAATREPDEPQKVERSLFEEVPELDHFHESIRSRYGEIAEHPLRTKGTNGHPHTLVEPAEKEKLVRTPAQEVAKATFPIALIKTALCVEAREGILYIFLPPLDYLEHYLDLVASVEATASELQIPVRIEGYEPPRDNRLERIVISPDPGVLEVNIHPASSWKELVYHQEVLYEQAYLSRLGTEKFMLDGKHTGTGGGNHITIGGRTPADSPLLRRPDLLRSLITFWQHHPGLSYLFSSAFIGPTSQAPRIDEGRDEKLYEMEIAFGQVPDHGFIPFWQVDRIFRHLLTDITGNTHRSEFCIDKLYSPDSSSGRLGILEFRAFDMPPHKQMSLVQMLLIRALVAWFWKKPYQHPLVRWGTELHDKFMLPHYVYLDLQEIVKGLNLAGYPFQMSWFEPFFEFRFPHYGSINLQGVEMEIRMAIEPWHVLGEEMSSSGTARFVDSSLERIQILLRGINSARYVLLCNGSRVPLRPTGIKEEFVAGIRYRAWQPPSALHPTIGVDTPLTLDIIDTWNSRSIGGCTYFVSHPGGRSYDTFPINSFEAEARRVSRFTDTYHSQDVLRPGPYLSTIQHYIEQNNAVFLADPPAEEVNKEYPFTLDLRQFHKKR